MKFQIAKENLERAMQRIDAIVPTRDTQTLLSNVLLDTDDNSLRITASDMESTVQISLPTQENEKGEIIVRAKALSDIAKRIKSDKIHFSAEIDEETLSRDSKMYRVTVSGDSQRAARYNISGSDKSHFPDMPSVVDKNLSSVSGSVLSEMIAKTVYSISQEDNRYIYNGLCFIADGTSLTMVGTDGRRLSAITRELSEPLSWNSKTEGDVVVHAKAVQELQKILDYSDVVKVGIEQRNIFFRIGNADLSSRLLEGKFPDYKKVIPVESPLAFEIPRNTIFEALNQVFIMAEPPSHQVLLDMSSNKVALLAKTPDKGNAEVEIPVEYTSSPMTIGFNASYLIDILKNLSCEKVRLEFTDPSKPIVIKDTEEKNFIALVMPMKISN